MEGIKHHLLSFLNYNESCSVRDYRDKAMNVISFFYMNKIFNLYK